MITLVNVTGFECSVAVYCGSEMTVSSEHCYLSRLQGCPGKASTWQVQKHMSVWQDCNFVAFGQFIRGLTLNSSPLRPIDLDLQYN